MAALNPVLLLIGGEWTPLTGRPTTPVHNPSSGEVIAETPLAGAETVDQAVQAAAAAFPAWMETPPVDRARILFRLKVMLEDRFDELAQSVTREHGKTLAEARGDVRRGLENIEFACGIPSLLMGESLENVARGIDCDTIRQPLGVVAGITPFNFPAMVPLWMWPLAIACGNTFVLKPSDKVPLTTNLIAAAALEAGSNHPLARAVVDAAARRDIEAGLRAGFARIEDAPPSPGSSCLRVCARNVLRTRWRSVVKSSRHAARAVRI